MYGGQNVANLRTERTVTRWHLNFPPNNPHQIFSVVEIRKFQTLENYALLRREVNVYGNSEFIAMALYLLACKMNHIWRKNTEISAMMHHFDKEKRKIAAEIHKS